MSDMWQGKGCFAKASNERMLDCIVLVLDTTDDYFRATMSGELQCSCVLTLFAEPDKGWVREPLLMPFIARWDRKLWFSLKAITLTQAVNVFPAVLRHLTSFFEQVPTFLSYFRGLLEQYVLLSLSATTAYIA